MPYGNHSLDAINARITADVSGGRHEAVGVYLLLTTLALWFGLAAGRNRQLH